MEKTVFDFIRELLTSDGIPFHCVTLPCQDWDWFDFGLRTKILGMENISQKLNQDFESLPDDTLFHYVDSFQCNYTILSLTEEEGEFLAPENPSSEDRASTIRPLAEPLSSAMEHTAGRQFMVIGPVLFESFYGERFDNLFREMELSAHLMEPLRSHYQNIPVIPSPSHYENLLTVISKFIYTRKPRQIHFKSEGDLENLRLHYGGISRIPEQPFLNLRYIEDRYEAENLIITAVSQGNEVLAMEGIRKLQNSGMPPRLANKLRDKKDLSITLNTLMRKSAELAGVHPIHIDSFSNQSIQQIEQLGSVEQCGVFQQKLTLGYCRLVKKYSLAGYSLPIQKVITHITSDLSADLSLKALAGRLNVTSSYLSSLFRKEVGVTLTDYVNQQRIAHARHLLLNTSYPIKSIAQQCGIADLNYFVRMFKRIVGVTPKVYRDTMAHSQQLGIIRNQDEECDYTPGK